MIPAIIEVARAGALSSTVLTWFTLGIFAGAVGKSAQFPLHVWLPDAMEGPTPVSALIHAATMVAAGVYLVARLFPVFDLVPETLQLVGFIGALTAIGAAGIGLVMTDIKRVLAYSTISQLGYMMLALGVGGLTAGIFHLFTHAFFKALLFLGSGSVNHATNTFDMRLMGGLRRSMPITFATFVIGSLSLAGIPPFAGFFSKDEILLDSFSAMPVLFWVALITAGLTAFYMGRVIFLTFFGEYRGGEPPAHDETPAGDHTEHASHGPHESPWSMALPLLVLAVPATIAGFANIGGDITHLLEGTLPADMERHHAEFNAGIAVLSTVVALSGLLLSWLIYHRKMISSDALYRFFEPIPTALNNKYYLDAIYENVIVNTFFYRGIVRLAAAFDGYVIDGLVNDVARFVRIASAGLRRTQTGDLQAYAAVFVGGVIIILGVIFLAGRI
jgi:NADH-quinone oxidoreductase subunit L